MAGMIAGVEVYRISLGSACPQATCVDRAKVRPVNDREYYSELHALLSSAKTSIHMVEFELKYYEKFKGSLQNQIVQDLIDAKERGVDVRIVMDEFSNENNAFDVLTARGVGIKLDSENVTTHAKLVIVDGKAVLVGSTNLSYYALEKNNEANVLIEDEASARDFEKYFLGLWNAS